MTPSDKMPNIVHAAEGTMEGAYVVIYDYDDENGDEMEEYYGYFSNAEEAEEAFSHLKPPVSSFRNVYVCRLVKKLKV
jgi:hypothetical protein